MREWWWFIHQVRSNPSDPMDCSPPGLFPWDFPDKNTGMGCQFLLQGVFQIQGSNPGLLHCRQILYCLSHRESHYLMAIIVIGFPRHLSRKEFACQAGSTGSIPGSGRPLEKETAAHFSVLAWKTPKTEECGGLQVHED